MNHLEETPQTQGTTKPAWEVEYWEGIMVEAMESGDQERYEMAKERAYGTESEGEEINGK